MVVPATVLLRVVSFAGGRQPSEWAASLAPAFPRLCAIQSGPGVVQCMRPDSAQVTSHVQEAVTSTSTPPLDDLLGSAVAYYHLDSHQAAVDALAKVAAALPEAAQAYRTVIAYSCAMIQLRSKEAGLVTSGFELINTLIQQADPVSSPYLFYGLALFQKALRKPNEDTLSAINQGLSYLKASTRMQFESAWPDRLKALFIESSGDGLAKELATLKAQLLSPAPPEATCRYEGCQSASAAGNQTWLPVRREIYSDDLDYFGFVSVSCSQMCLVDFHPFCWMQVMKTEAADSHKDLLKRPCLSRDCPGYITKLRIFKNNGTCRVIKPMARTEPARAPPPPPSPSPPPPPQQQQQHRVGQVHSPSPPLQPDMPCAWPAFTDQVAGFVKSPRREVKDPVPAPASLKKKPVRDAARSVEHAARSSMRPEASPPGRRSSAAPVEEERIRWSGQATDAVCKWPDVPRAPPTPTSPFPDDWSELAGRANVAWAWNMVLDECVKQLGLLNFINDTLLMGRSSALKRLLEEYRSVVVVAQDRLLSFDPTPVQMPDGLSHEELDALQQEHHSLYSCTCNLNRLQVVEAMSTLSRVVEQVQNVFPDQSEDQVLRHLVALRSRSGGTLASLQMHDLMEYIAEDRTSRVMECVICLEILDTQKEVLALQPCRHTFHKSCISTWLDARRNCPCCREPVLLLDRDFPRLRPSDDPPQ